MKKLFAGSAMIFSVFGSLAYLGAHIWGAVFLFKTVKLWLFLVMLLVPGIGDFAAIFSLIKSGYWLPIILYAAAIVLWLVGGVSAQKADKL